MHINDFFTSKKQIDLLEKLLLGPELNIGIRQMARTVAVSPALVSKTVQLLRKHEIVKNGKIDYSVPVVSSIKALINICKFDNKALAKICSIVPEIKGIGIYGSWANGTNNADSDLDLWIKVKKNVEDSKILGLRKYLKEKFNAEPSVLVLTEEKIRQLRQNDVVFYCSLIGSKLMWGEPID